MTDLQASLIVIGGVIVVAVVSYNKWQEHKTKNTVERAFAPPHDDVLMRADTPLPPADAERQEPVFGDPAPPLAQTVENAPAIEPAGPEPRVAEQGFLHVQHKDLPVDQLIDCTIPLGLEGPVRGEKIMPLLQSLRHVGNKPVHFIGLADDGRWEGIAHGRLYTLLQAGIQLANRTTALNEIEYSEFVSRLRQLADDLGAECDVPDMTKVMAIARGLHQFVSEYGAQLSVNVESNGSPWEIGTLRGALARQGFDLRPDGRLMMQDGDGGTLFSIFTNVAPAEETTSRLTLLLDVPCVAPARDGFGAMIGCARSLSARLDGKVVDDTGHPLSDAALAEIATQVHAFYDDMENAEIPAGSNRALRLFA